MTESIDPRSGSRGSLDTSMVRVSDDPGRPDYTIDGAPGALLIIISGPSGVGKDTIIDAIRRRERETGRDGQRHYVVTVTTRAPRAGELQGVDYHFVIRAEFLRIRDARGFLEANEVHGNWYGSPRDQVRSALAAGKDAILKIDVQGAQVVKEQHAQAGITRTLVELRGNPLQADPAARHAHHLDHVDAGDVFQAVALAVDLVLAQQIGERAAGQEQRNRDDRDERRDQVGPQRGEGQPQARLRRAGAASPGSASTSL
jgi:hypothetical protein